MTHNLLLGGNDLLNQRNRIGIFLKEAAIEFDKKSNHLLAQYQLTQPQFNLLSCLLVNQDRIIRQVDLEKQFRLSSPTVTRLLHQLETKGFVKRVPNPDDARSKQIVLTSEALSQQAALLDSADQLEKEIRSGLSDSELKSGLTFMQKILKNLEN